MPTMDTYALGVEALRESYKNGECKLQPFYTRTDGSRIVRPLTFKENIEARVNDYTTLHNPDGSAKTDDERSRLFNHLLDSCTAIAYKKGTSKFKIIPQSPGLIEIASTFNEYFLPIDYNSIKVAELDSNKGKYNSLLTKKEVICHPAWLAAVEDRALLTEYANIVFKFLKEKHAKTDGMRFLFSSNTETDVLHALCVYSIYNYTDAFGFDYLEGKGSFLMVAPSQKISTGNEGEKQ